MATYYYAENEAQQSITSSGTYTTVLSLSFTPPDNSTWVIFASWKTIPAATYGILSKLTRTTGTPKDFNESTNSSYERTGMSCIAIDSFGVNPGQQTYEIQARNNALVTGYVQYCHIFALQLGVEDQQAVSEGQSSTISTTYTDKLSLTFTPSAAADYLVLGYAEFFSSATTTGAKARMDIDGTIYGEGITSSTAWVPWVYAKKVSLTAASHTIKIQFASSSAGGTVYIRNARIVVIKLSQFPANYYAEDETRTTTTSTAYVDKVSLTQTPAAVDHVYIYQFTLDEASTTRYANGRAIKDTSVFSETRSRPVATADRYPHFVVKKETPAAASATWKIQYSTSASAAAAGCAWAKILVIQLATTGGYVLSADPGNYPVSGVAAKTVADRSIPADPGSFSYLGVAATLALLRGISAQAGSYGVNGIASALLAARFVSASSGSYAVTGIEALLQVTGAGFVLEALAGSYSVAGVANALLTARAISALPGAHTVVGVDSSLLTSRVIAALAGAYTAVGADSALLVARIISALAGGYAVAGADSALLATRLMSALAGSYTTVGAPDMLVVARIISALAGAYNVVGVDSKLLTTRIIAALAGLHVATGMDALLQKAGEVAIQESFAVLRRRRR